jgi:hypothetical protein
MINFVKGLILLAGNGKISVEEVGHNSFIERTFSCNDCSTSKNMSLEESTS